MILQGLLRYSICVWKRINKNTILEYWYWVILVSISIGCGFGIANLPWKTKLENFEKIMIDSESSALMPLIKLIRHHCFRQKALLDEKIKNLKLLSQNLRFLFFS
jgi:hypothetical protein